jgi:hypothetical protein
MKNLININGSLNNDLVNEISNSIINHVENLDGGFRSLYDNIKSFMRNTGDMRIQGDDDLLTENTKRAINNGYTNLTSKELTHDPKKMKLIVNLTYNIFTEIIEKYCEKMGINKDDIIFVYKGGNVLRFLFKEGMKEFPSNSSYAVYEELSNFFKISDNDYSILINPNIPDYDEIFNGVTAISYLVLCVIRKVIVENLPLLYDYYDKTYDSKKNIINSRFDEINNLIKEILNGHIVSIYHGQDKFVFDNALDVNTDLHTETYNRDLGILNNGVQNNPETIGTFSIPQLGMSNLYIPFRNSLNEMNKYDWDNKQGTTRFNLVRMKATFPTTVKLHDGTNRHFNFTGELIDVSIPYKMHFDPSTIAIYKDETFDLEFKSYSFDHYITDLEFILFDQLLFPWDDVKYNKRLIRLVFMYCYNLLFFSTNNEPRINSINDVLIILKYILDLFKHIKNPENINRLKESTGLLKGIFTSDKIRFKKFFNYFDIIIDNIIASPDRDLHYRELIKFVDKLHDNIYKLYSIFYRVQNFIDRGGEIYPKDLYRGLSGGVIESLEYGDRFLYSLSTL